MNEQQAIDAARQVGVAPGDHIFVQTDGQIMHPHGDDLHVDGWRVENVSGTYVATKVHSV